MQDALREEPRSARLVLSNQAEAEEGYCSCCTRTSWEDAQFPAITQPCGSCSLLSAKPSPGVRCYWKFLLLEKRYRDTQHLKLCMQMHSKQQPLRHPARREAQREIVPFAGRGRKKKALALLIYLGRGWGPAGNLSRRGKPLRLTWLQSSSFPGTERRRCRRGAMCLLPAHCLPLRSDSGQPPPGRGVAVAPIHLTQLEIMMNPQAVGVRGICVVQPSLFIPTSIPASVYTRMGPSPDRGANRAP